MEDNVTAKERVPIVLGGRSFRVIDFDKRTVLADHYLAKLLRQTGADKVLPVEGETNQGYLVRMQTLLVDSGKCHELIAGLLLPVGTEEKAWTPALAREIAGHIAQCNTPEDRELVMDLSLQVVFGFFKQGLAWLTRSLSSSIKGIEKESGAASPQETSKT